MVPYCDEFRYFIASRGEDVDAAAANSEDGKDGPSDVLESNWDVYDGHTHYFFNQNTDGSVADAKVPVTNLYPDWINDYDVWMDLASKTSEGQRSMRRNALEKYHTVVYVAGEILFMKV